MTDPIPQLDRQTTVGMGAIGAAVIVALTLLAYLPVIVSGGFIWDDDSYLTRNAVLQAPDALALIWTPGNTPQYYPMVFSTFWVELQLWDLDPRGYHLVNVLLHAASSILVWRLLARLRVPGAWIAGMVFALHPVNVESVAWITERKNVLSMVFALAAAWSFLSFDERWSKSNDDRRGAWGWYGLALVLFVMALLSKTVACSLPAVLALLLLWKRRLTPGRLALLAPMFALGLALAILTITIERDQVGAFGPEFDISLVERIVIACRALLFYPAKLLVPWPLMFIYPRWTIDVVSPQAIGSVVSVLGLSAVLLALFVRGRRGPAVAAAIYAGVLFPALGFINVYPHRFSFVADHFQYHAAPALIALAAAGWSLLWRCPRRSILFAAAPLLVLIILTWSQTTIYHDVETLWRDTVRKNIDGWMPRNNLSSTLLRRADELIAIGEIDEAAVLVAEAREHAAQAIDLKPDHGPAHANLSEALRLEGRYGEAVHHATRAAELGRARAAAIGADPLPRQLVSDEVRLARLLELLDRTEEARDAYLRSLEIDPGALPVRLELARLLRASGDDDAALEQFRAILERDEANFTALTNAAWLREEAADYGAAHGLYLKAVESARSLEQRIQVITRLIRFRTTCPDEAFRDLDQATWLAEQLVQLTEEKDPGAFAVLGNVYATAGRLEDARAAAARGAELARSMGLTEVAVQIEKDAAEWE